jgi:hypothetical protein
MKLIGANWCDGMIEISVVDEKPQLVAGMRRRGDYKEIAKMLPAFLNMH